MRWDDRLGDLFDDLEQQADGLALGERDAEVAELSRSEYAQVDLTARLHASVGVRLLVAVTGVGRVDGALRRVGEGWCLLDDGAQEWIVRLPAVGSVRGLADRALPQAARPVTAGLGLGSAIRGAGEARGDSVLHRVDGSVTRGTLGRVGADFVEVLETWVDEAASRSVEIVPFGALAAVRSA